MKSILVDTSAWIALNSKNDQLHDKAVEINRELLESGYRYITTNFILDETYTLLRARVGQGASVDFGERIRKSIVVQIVDITREIEEDAWEIFKKYADKDFSYTDCTSFAAMQMMEINK